MYKTLGVLSLKTFAIISWGGECQAFFILIKYCKKNKNNIDIVKNFEGDICGLF